MGAGATKFFKDVGKGIAAPFKNIYTLIKNPQELTVLETGEFFNKQITTIVSRRIQKCIAPIQASQFISITCNVSEAVANAFANSVACVTCRTNNASIPEPQQSANCPICFACIATDINQNLILVADFNACAPFGPDVAQVATQVSEDIQRQLINNPQMASHWTIAQNSLVKKFTDTELKSLMKDVITTDDITTIMFAVQTQQAVTLVSRGGSSQGGVTQSVLQYQISQVVANKMTQIGFDNVSNIANNTVSPATKLQESQQLTYMLITYSLAAIVAILLLVMIVLTFRRNPPQPQHAPVAYAAAP